MIEAAKLLQEQKDLEGDSYVQTLRRYHKMHDKAAKRDDYSSTHCGRAVVEHCIKPFEDSIQKFVDESMAGKAGRTNRAAELLVQLDVPTVAYLFTKAIFNYVPIHIKEGKTAAASSVAIKACGMLHDELRMRWFQDNSPRYVKKLLKSFDQDNLSRARRRDIVQRKFRQMEMEWRVWSDSDMVKLGVKLLELFRDSTGMIKIAQVAEGLKRRKIVQATPELLEKIGERMSANESIFSVYQPMIIPPKPWQEGALYGGGYYTNKVSRYPFIKGVKRTFLEELNNTDMCQVLRAVNAIQETPFRVNTIVVDLLEFIFDSNREIADVPLCEQEKIPEAPLGADVKGPIKDQYRRDCYAVHDRNRRRISKRLMVARAINSARKFSNYDRIYFPLQADSRGRLYPVPAIFNTQGPDFIRATIEYAEGKPINDEQSAAWLAIIGANHWGEDKVSLQERVDWVMQNQQMICDIAHDPFSDLRWTEADEPFQFVRWCMAWSEFRAEGYGYVCHLPANVDATCSGMQIFSAALKDRAGAAWVNLTNSRERKDIYQAVADLSMTYMRNENDPEKIDYATAALAFGVSRSMTKRPTMVVPYSGTFHACMKYTRDGIKERLLKGEPHPWPHEENDGKFIAYVAGCIWRAIDETIPAARECMRWLQTASKLISKSDTPLPMIWWTPDGMPVQQARYLQTTERVSTFLDGSRVRLDIHHDTKELDPKRMSSSIAPNWVHSLDASVMRQAVNNALDIEDTTGRGRMYFNMIHDSFGVHVSDLPDFLDRCIKPAFVQIFGEEDVIDNFEKEVRKILDDEQLEQLPPSPVRGDYNVKEVTQNDFFFS